MKIQDLRESPILHRPLLKFLRNHTDKYMFKNLPPTAQKAIIEWYSEGDTEVNSDDLWEYGIVPFDELQEFIIDSLNRHEGTDYKSFDEYHDDYSKGGGIPRHNEIWPVIITVYDSNMELVLDGFHRLHSYYRDNLKAIPVLFAHNENLK